jgi:hypothetical protein
MVGAICNSLSYIVASPFKALWQMFGDKMGNQVRSLSEVESPHCIFGGAVSLCQSCVLAHVLGPGFDQGVAPRGVPSSLRKYCTNSEKRTTYPFVRDRVILPAAAVGGGERSRRPLHEALSGHQRSETTYTLSPKVPRPADRGWRPAVRALKELK